MPISIACQDTILLLMKLSIIIIIIYRRKINVRGDDNTEDKFTRTCGIESKSRNIIKN